MFDFGGKSQHLSATSALLSHQPTAYNNSNSNDSSDHLDYDYDFNCYDDHHNHRYCFTNNTCLDQTDHTALQFSGR